MIFLELLSLLVLYCLYLFSVVVLRLQKRYRISLRGIDIWI